MKKVLIIAGSPRKDGNSDLLALQFAKGAAESGNEVFALSCSYTYGPMGATNVTVK